MVQYQQGTRRTEELIAEARQLAYQENYSFTEGWDDNVVVDIMNFGLSYLYNYLTEIDSPPNVEEVTLDVFAQQQAYDLPIDVHMALRLIDIRFLYGPTTATWAFVTLRQGAIQDRFSYPTNIPDTYCIRNGQILLSPTPNVTRLASLIINYQKRMRKFDVRRGRIDSVVSLNGSIASISYAGAICTINTVGAHGLSTSDSVSLQSITGSDQLNGNTYVITVTGATSFTLNGVDPTLFVPYVSGGVWYKSPVQFLLNFSVTSQKDVNMQANANSILDKIDYATIVNWNGDAVVNAMRLQGYNQTSQILTCLPGYIMTAAEITALNSSLAFGSNQYLYVLQGDYSSSHSQLDRECENHLKEYMVLRLLRLQSAAEPTRDQAEAEEKALQRMIAAYRRYRPSVMPIVWIERLRPQSYPFGRRGLY